MFEFIEIAPYLPSYQDTKSNGINSNVPATASYLYFNRCLSKTPVIILVVKELQKKTNYNRRISNTWSYLGAYKKDKFTRFFFCRSKRHKDKIKHKSKSILNNLIKEVCLHPIELNFYRLRL